MREPPAPLSKYPEPEYSVPPVPEPYLGSTRAPPQPELIPDYDALDLYTRNRGFFEQCNVSLDEVALAHDVLSNTFPDKDVSPLVCRLAYELQSKPHPKHAEARRVLAQYVSLADKIDHRLKRRN